MAKLEPFTWRGIVFNPEPATWRSYKSVGVDGFEFVVRQEGHEDDWMALLVFPASAVEGSGFSPEHALEKLRMGLLEKLRKERRELNSALSQAELSIDRFHTALGES